MQNMDNYHNDGGTESCDASESGHGQTVTGFDPAGQTMSPGSAGNMGNNDFINNGRNIYPGTAQGSTPSPQSPQMTFTGQAGVGMDGGESGSQNAYDIPRYTSEGHILGRPQEENNPQSAGNVHGGGQIPQQPGSFQGVASGAYQQMQPQGMYYNQVPPQMHFYFFPYSLKPSFLASSVSTII